MEKIEILEYFEGNESHFAKKIEDRDNRFLIEKASKQKLKLSANRVLFNHIITSDKELPEIIDKLSKSIEKQKTNFSVIELWELAQEDIREYSVEELASFFVDNPDTVTQSALFHLIREEKNHFKRKGTLVTPRKAEQIEEILIQENKEKEKQEIYSFFSDNIGLAMRNDSLANPEIFNHLKVWLKDPSNELLSSVIDKYANGQDSRFFVYNLLKINQIIPENSDKFATIYGISTDFSQATKFEAERLEITCSDREDLSHLTSYTIDSEETKEIDDAISFDRLDGEYLLGIHITDLASFISKDSVLDQEAFERVSTVYLETGEIPMFPSEICHDKLSLVKDKIRPCLSALFTFSEDFELISRRFTLANLTVRHKISYNELDKIIRKSKSDPSHDFNILKKLTDKLRKKRFEAGAIEINRPEIEIRVVDGKIKLSATNQRSISRRIISELMILMNNNIAEFAAQNQLPFIYRIQEMPNEDYKHYLQPDFYDPIMNDKLIRMIRPSNFSSQPSKHYGLGVDFYSQTTSPLRRYFDLLMQRQIVSFLKQQTALYNQEELLSFITNIEATNKHYSQLYTASFNFWFLKYLEENLKYEPLSAVVVSDNQNSYTFELLDFGKRYNLRTKDNLAIGDTVSLLIEKIQAEKDIIKFSLIND
jgi:exoribonuclease-2